MAKQLKLNLYKGMRGGRRPGAGRKRLHSKGVAHRKRETVNFRHALHVNFKFRTTIRNKFSLGVLRKAIIKARFHGLRIIHFSMQSNHIHLILEAHDTEILSKGMRSLTITFAKGLKKGSIQIERYHLHVLRSLRETKNAVHYVLFNEQRHSGLKKAYVTPYSSLGSVKDLKALAKAAKMIIVKGRERITYGLDSPRSWALVSFQAPG
jgi:REP element-mobilizing transposase RayT